MPFFIQIIGLNMQLHRLCGQSLQNIRKCQPKITWKMLCFFLNFEQFNQLRKVVK